MQREKTELDEHGQPGYFINYRDRVDRGLNEMLGLARGIIMDGVVHDLEARELRTWIGRNPDLCVGFPGREVYERLAAIYVDGKVDEGERQELLELLQGLAGEPGVSDAPEAGGSTMLPLDDPPPKIEHGGSMFCVTGRFLVGCRDAVKGRLEERGARVHPRITKEVDYLLLGSMASRDWKHSSFGRKIEAAVSLRDAGHPIAIISEAHWCAHLR